MAAPLSRVHATVVTPTGTHEGVSIQIPPGRNTALVRRRTEQLITQPGVVSVERQGRGHHWTVTFDTGETWDVQDTAKPCGCS